MTTVSPAAVSGSVRDDSPLAIALDLLALTSISTGVVLTLIATVGILRLPDVLSRMHAATKPQTLALLLVVIGGALLLRSSNDMWMLILVGAFQLISAPVTAHVVSGLAHRTGGVRSDLLYVDDLADRREREG